MAKKTEQLPSVEQLQQELDKANYRHGFRSAIMRTIGVLIVVAAIVTLISTQFMPVLQITGGSMTPTLNDGELLITIKGTSFARGDIIAFYYNNKILVKRVIALEGEYVRIDDEGNVYVDNVPLDEPYISEKAFGECNIDLPYQVPDGKIFVMGDHRATSTDSRNTAIGCVSNEQVVGRILFRIWPWESIGLI